MRTRTARTASSGTRSARVGALRARGPGPSAPTAGSAHSPATLPGGPVTADGLLDLQRTAGNRAVTALLVARFAAPPGTPTTGEGHDLTSDVLRGDPELERVKEGAAVVRRGVRGGHVTRLQQALTAVGHSPGPVDGDYGGGTAAAVRSFQQASGMGIAEQDGIVGKRTLTVLDTAVRHGGAAPDPDAEAEDAVIRDKHPGSEPDRIYFPLASADLDAAEQTKITTFAAQHQGTHLWLTGLASEEGPEAGNRALASQRLDAVLGVIGTHLGGVTGTASPEKARGSSRYRFMRAVQIDLSEPQDPPSCAEDAPTEEPCDPTRQQLLDVSRGQSDRALGTAVSALTATDRTQGAAARADQLLDQLYGTTDDDRDAVRTQVAGQAEAVRTALGDDSRFLCATTCDPGHTSGHTAVESGGRITLYERFFSDTHTPAPVRAPIVVHEGHHAALPGDDEDNGRISSTDLAYNHARLFGHLTPPQALRNASSFHALVVHTAQPAGTPLNARQTQITPKHDDDMSELPETLHRSFQRAIGWIEQWVGTTDFMVASLYRRGSHARDRGRWDSDEGQVADFYADFLRPRFGLQAAPGRPPTEQDLRMVAAINDRVDIMKRAIDQPLTLRRGTGPGSSWERGPGATIAVAEDLLGADDNVRTSILLDELVRATPGISARLHVEYSALIRSIRTYRERLGPES
jgi:peptidoglycan hydrolase-like protein with peptidoglycan-binding domain